MKLFFPTILVTLIFFALASCSNIKTGTIGNGEQPQIAMDNRGVIRVVFGQKDKIFCASSHDKGVSFSSPVLVAQVPGMHLGMSRGPQLTCSANYSVITAMDKTGNIHWYRLSNTSSKWKDMGLVNDLKKSAPEGLMSIASDKKDHFYAVWLDTRAGGGNNIFYSSLSNPLGTWSKNRLVYRSPDNMVCGCCQPSIAVYGPEVVILFRNWLNGSRDLYLLKSLDGGASFAAAEKLGLGTWKLNGCPMDGGGIMVDGSNLIQTTWQRKGDVFYDVPGEPEVKIEQGRDCSISGAGNHTVLTFQHHDTVWVMNFSNKTEISLGKGGFLKSIVLPGNKVLGIWEVDHQIKFKKV
ncbi:MAG: hypothetical protein ACYCOO_03675 [Chitinophagaceae bacterium]